METFIAGAGYGLTSVIVGQPLDTIKTRMQAMMNSGTLGKDVKPTTFSIGRDLMREHGVLGLYKGSLPTMIGGTLYRSAQFGFMDLGHSMINKYRSNCAANNKKSFFDIPGGSLLQTAIAGLLGGIGRGFVEVPFEFIKTRQQVDNKFRVREMLAGSGTTIARSSGLFMFYMSYIDISKSVFPQTLSVFWTGAICSIFAWLTIWPLDVIKSQRQSGYFGNQSFMQLLHMNVKNRTLFSGVMPGLGRSFLANGFSLVVYTEMMQYFNSRKSIKET